MSNKVTVSKYVNPGDGTLKVKTKVINQGSLTPDCWLVQFWGLSACKTCELEGKDDCGGEKILKKIKEGKFSSEGLPDVGYPKGG